MNDDAELVQNTHDWLIARAGSLGGSQIGVAIKRVKRGGERMKEAVDLQYEIAAERLTGVPAKQVNARSWGLQKQEEARDLYELRTNLELVIVGLIRHPTIKGAHASPDALVGDEGGVEIKCPTSATHLKTLLEKRIPDEHLPQIFWNMACTGRAWWDFVSYDPRFLDPKQRYFCARVERDQAAIEALEDEAYRFITELEEKLASLEVA